MLRVAPDIRLTCDVLDLEGLVVHADVVRRHVEELGLRRVRGRLLILAAKAAGHTFFVLTS
jgi:hypothetical protein